MGIIKDLHAPTLSLSLKPGSGRPTRWIAPVLAGALGAGSAGLLFLLAHRGLGDDAYITLSYARNLALHGHWGLTEFRTSNTATSPLNVWLLAGLIVVVGRPVVAVGLLLMCACAALSMWSLSIARLIGASWVLPFLAVGALLVNPFLITTIGLETYLAAALTVGVTRYSIAGRAVATGVFAGLLVLTRPDLIVVNIVIFLGLIGKPRKIIYAAGAALMVALPWHVFTWFTFGSAIPDTFAFKTLEGRFTDDGPTLATAIIKFYGATFPYATAMALVPAVFVVASIPWWVRRYIRRGNIVGARTAILFSSAGMAHLLVLVFGIHADPYSWYYAPFLIGLTMAMAVTAGLIREWWGGTFSALMVSGTFIGLLLTAGPIPWKTLPVHGNWGTSQEYELAAHGLGIPPNTTVSSPGEIGALAYFCQCDIVDWLSDRGQGQIVLDKRLRIAGPVMRSLLRLNYRNLPHVPPARAEYRLDLVRPGQKPPESLRSWPVSSPLHGERALVLTR